MTAHDFIRQAKLHDKKVAFPDAEDVRTLQAVQKLLSERICLPILVGNSDKICAVAENYSISLEHIPIIEPEKSFFFQEFSDSFFEKRKTKGITSELAESFIRQPLFFAGMMLDSGKIDACVAGSLSTTGDVLRAGIQTIGLADGNSTVSSFFLMIFPNQTLAYADCGVVPNPNVEQLADIAISTARNFEKLTHTKSKIAMLSFSTKGSAEHESITKVRQATAFVRKRSPELIVDGELQFDAAFIPSVAQRKAPDSLVAGQANVFIFPDLNSGNIAYKITERLGGAQAIGPIVQGLKKPFLDLSRGCSSDDIVMSAVIAGILSDSE